MCAVAVVLLARPAKASELAILRNGFSIRHEHRLVIGTNTRLFLAADDSSFTDVPTEEITGYEKDLTLAGAIGCAIAAARGCARDYLRPVWLCDEFLACEIWIREIRICEICSRSCSESSRELRQRRLSSRSRSREQRHSRRKRIQFARRFP